MCIIHEVKDIPEVKACLSDRTKFPLDASNKDVAPKVEKEVICQINNLHNQGLIDEVTLNNLRPIGSMIPKLYGLPKIHKVDCPVRPILSMCHSPTHQLAKWLTGILKPVNDVISEFCVSDSFTFAEKIRGADLRNRHLVSFDVTSLFTNVPINDTIDMIRQIIRDHNLQVGIPVDILCDLILLCVKNVQFIFDSQFYVQIDGVAMGSPLGPVLSNIFLGFLEKYRLRNDIICTTDMYFRYVDDTYLIVRSESDAKHLLTTFNSVHPNLNFTMELESDSSGLAFLDVHVSRDDSDTAVTAVHRKGTWTGLYLDFHSFVPIHYKRGLVRNLFHRARKIVPLRLSRTKNPFFSQL